MKVEALSIPDVKLIMPSIFKDERGFFSETFNARALASVGISEPFVQDNHSLSVLRGVVRGLHFQIPPHVQAKLVRVVRAWGGALRALVTGAQGQIARGGGGLRR